MTVRKLDKANWHAFFDFISKLLEGKQVEIEVASLALGDQVAAEWLPSLGLVHDPKDNRRHGRHQTDHKIARSLDTAGPGKLIQNNDRQ
jgi:Family of unknown function (DUF5335)